MSAAGRTVLALLVATAAGGASVACSMAVGFDGFVGPGDPSADDLTAEGGPDAGSPSAGEDAGPDSADDAGALADGAVVDPNGPPSFVDGGSFCGTAGPLALCDDFDTRDLAPFWLREGVFAKLTSNASRSAPNNFLVDAPAVTSGGTWVSKITKPLGAASTNMLVAFDFFPEKVNASSAFLILAALEYTANDQKFSVRLVYGNGTVRVEESNLVAPPNNVDTYHPFFSIPTSRWSRVKLDVVASGATPGVQVSVDDVAVMAREPLTPTPGMSPMPTLILGAVYAASPHTGWTLRYDNVTVTNR